MTDAFWLSWAYTETRNGSGAQLLRKGCRLFDRLRDEAAPGSPRTERVMADVGSLTDAEMTRSLFLPL